VCACACWCVFVLLCVCVFVCVFVCVCGGESVYKAEQWQAQGRTVQLLDTYTHHSDSDCDRQQEQKRTRMLDVSRVIWCVGSAAAGRLYCCMRTSYHTLAVHTSESCLIESCLIHVRLAPELQFAREIYKWDILAQNYEWWQFRVYKAIIRSFVCHHSTSHVYTRRAWK